MITLTQVQEFLAQRRLAVVGVSADPKKFGNVIHRELMQHGYDVIPIHRDMREIDGVRCFPDLASVPGDIDGVIIMVPSTASAAVVRDCIARGVTRVWLFKGLGAPGAVSDEAIELCRTSGIDVVAGACPLMFLEPVAGFHRFHRGIRKMNRSLVTTGA